MKIKVGDKVSTSASKDVNGVHLASFVQDNLYDVLQIGGQNYPDNYVVLGLRGKAITTVDIETLTRFNPATLMPQKIVGVSTDNPYAVAETSLLGNLTNGLVNAGNKVKTFMGSSAGKKLANGLMNIGMTLLSGAASKLFNKLGGYVSNLFSGTSDGDSKVMYLSKRYNASSAADYTYKEVQSAEYYKVMNMLRYGDLRYQMTKKQIDNLDRNAPEVYQTQILDERGNKIGVWPKLKSSPSPSKNSSKSAKNYGLYRYDYYTGTEFDDKKNYTDMEEIRRSVNLDLMNPQQLFRQYTKYYNRYKIQNPNDALTKAFGHVFFVRPDCNIYADGSTGANASPTLADNLKNLSEYYYALQHAPELLRELTQGKAGYDHEFMMFLSNKAKSFETSDEYVEDESYGDALTGHKVAYGKNNIKSKAAGEISIKYTDDKYLHIYHLHKLWTDYISHVYRGKVWPDINYVKNKILDYPTCLYYILTAEDGETIIFWSKYYGVFPTKTPSSNLMFDDSQRISNPEYTISYKYSWKEDFNPLSLVEFNTHGWNRDWRYVNTYQNSVLGTGYTWAGTPFIETFRGNRNDGNLPYTFKLRFHKA